MHAVDIEPAEELWSPFDNPHALVDRARHRLAFYEGEAHVLEEAIRLLEEALARSRGRAARGRSRGSGTYTRSDFLRLLLVAAAAVWADKRRGPTQGDVAAWIGYSRSGLEKALRRHRIDWQLVRTEARGRSFGRIRAETAA